MPGEEDDGLENPVPFAVFPPWLAEESRTRRRPARILPSAMLIQTRA
jgi:hypothetical protein